MGRSGARIPAEALISLRGRLATLAPRSASRALEVKRVAELYGISVSGVYRRERSVRAHPMVSGRVAPYLELRL